MWPKYLHGIPLREPSIKPAKTKVRLVVSHPRNLKPLIIAMMSGFFSFHGLPTAIPFINVVFEKKLCLTVPILSGHKIKTMKTLKILTVAFIASLFMLACEDAPEPIRFEKPVQPEQPADDQIDYQELYGHGPN